MSISVSGSNLTTGLNNTVLAPPYGSLSFNGINQAIVTNGGANNSTLDLTTGSPNWTIECWVYSSEHTETGFDQFFIQKDAGQTIGIMISTGDVSYATYGTNVLRAQIYSTTLGYAYLSSWPTTLSLNTWYHVAICKDATSANRYYMYLNGVLISSAAIPSVAVNNTQPFEIGGPPTYISADSRYFFNGLLSNIRIVKGVTIYLPPDATVPTPPLASTQSLNLSGYNQAITGTQTSLLLTTPNNASYLTDTSSYAQTVTGVNTPTSSSMGPSTYSGSILFDGVNQYLTIAAAAQFNYSTNDFTWEMWIYPTASDWNTTGLHYLIDHGPYIVNQGTLHYTNNKLVYYNYYNGGNTPPSTANYPYPTLYTIGGGSIPANTWTHVAVCRQNLVTNLLVNGKIVASGSDPYNYATTSNSPYSYPYPAATATQSVFIGARGDGNYVFKGNISNVRIVNGVSVYNVGNFTPPVQPLPPVQAPNTFGSPSNAIFGSQTSLLMNTSYNNSFLTDGSFNNVTLTQETVGQSPKSTYTLTNNSTNPFNSNGSVFTPGSVFFNGTTQYLTVPANAVFAFGTSAFTVEAWVNLTTIQDTLVFDTRTSAATTGIGFQINSSGVLSYIQSASTTLGTAALTIGTWNHIAWVYDGTTITGYVNGVPGTPSTVSLSLTQNSATIGRSGVSSASFIAGYLSNLRVVKGTAVYTQSFIPTSGPFTTSQTFNQSGIPSCPVQSSQTSLLLATPSNTSFLTDSSTNAFTVTNNGSATSNPFNPFSGNYTILSNPGSVQLNGTSQYLSIPSNAALNFGTGNFTVEAWVNTTAANTGDFFIISSTGTGGFFVGYNSAAASYGWGVTGLTWDYNTGATKTNGVWQHIAVTRSGTSMRIFVNGVQAGTTQTISTAYDLSLTSTVVGWQQLTYYFPGYISNLRVVKGIAVYTSNFTPPAGPLNNSQVANQSGAPSAAVTISQTSLLLNTAFGTNFLVDSSINNFTVTNNGTATSATLDPFVF